VGTNLGLRPARAQEPTIDLKPEAGATLRVLRPAKFVKGDETMWLENTQKYTKTTGVEVKVESQGWEDLRPKAAVAANVGKGPDVVYGWYDDAHQYPEKLVDLTDLGEYLDKKYGGWYDVCKKFGKVGDKWVAIPLGAAGARIVYRISALKEAGFDAWPKDMDGMLKVTQALAAKGKPGGLRPRQRGRRRQHLVPLAGVVVRRQDGRRERPGRHQQPGDHQGAGIRGRALQDVCAGHAVLARPFQQQGLSRQPAFLDHQRHLHLLRRQDSDDPKIKALAEDINHAVLPVGPVGRPTELHLTVPAMVFAYTKYPNAAKDYIRFMLEREQYVPWQEASIGYFSQPLREYEKSPIWTADPKHTPYRDLMVNMQWPGYAGSLGYASAGVMADFVMVNMVAQAASGDKSPADAAAEAQKRAERYYKV